MNGFKRRDQELQCGIQTDSPCFTDYGTQSYPVDQNLRTDQEIQCKLSSVETVSLRKECSKKQEYISHITRVPKNTYPVHTEPSHGSCNESDILLHTTVEARSVTWLGHCS